MPSNVRQLLENGTPIYPITERSLVIGLQDAPFEYYVLAWDGASTPVVSKIPAGVVVTYNGTSYTGTLAASSTTAPYLYLVASTTQAGEYDRYIVTNNGNNTFSWTPVGSTAPVTPVIVDDLVTNDATKALSAKQGKVLKDELSQFEAKVTEKTGGEVAPPLSLEQGGISSATGANSVSTTRLRTSNYITADGISIVTSGNKVYVMGYKDDGTYVDANGWLSSSQEVRITGAKKYRLVFAFSNDDTINVGDFDTLGIAIKSVYDGKLATKAALALTDAKVGILEDKANDLKLPVYGGSQVITYIDGEYVNPSTGSFTRYTGWSRTGYLNVQGLANLEYINPSEDSTYNAFYDKDKVFISGFRTFKRTTLATVSVPTNAVWCVLSNISAAIRQLTLPNLRAFSGIVVLEDNVKKLSVQSQNNRINTATSINDIKEYVALQQAVRIDFILSILLNARIQISVTSDYRVSYSLQEADGTTLYDSAWVTSVNLQDTLYNYPTTSRIRLYFKKADGSATSLADIKANAVSEMIVDYVASEWNTRPDLTIDNSILKDIHDLAVGGNGILDLNPEKEVVPKLGNLTRRYISYGGSATEHPPVLSFIHMSDAHADNENILRIKSFYDKYSEYLNGGVIDTGDFIGQNLAQGLPSSTPEVPDFIRILGNHDAYYYENSTWQLAPQLDCYNVCFKDYIGNWGVVQPENAATYGYCYFYKDFTDSGIMMVALDYDHWDSTQNTWLVNTLATALSLGRHVVILVHRAPFRITANTSNPFQNVDYINRTFADHYPMTDVYTDVKNFIDGGGIFVCYLCGHLHDDYFGLGRDTDTNNQLVIGVGCVSDAVSATVSGTMSRISGQKSQDCFNVVGVDTTSKTLKIMRIGADYDRYMRKKNTLSWNYGTGQLIYVD